MLWFVRLYRWHVLFVLLLQCNKSKNTKNQSWLLWIFGIMIQTCQTWHLSLFYLLSWKNRIWTRSDIFYNVRSARIKACEEEVIRMEWFKYFRKMPNSINVVITSIWSRIISQSWSEEIVKMLKTAEVKNIWRVCVYLIWLHGSVHKPEF